jgi:hypothetical protein
MNDYVHLMLWQHQHRELVAALEEVRAAKHLRAEQPRALARRPGRFHGSWIRRWALS